jgi:hypothetical protein
MTMLGLLNPGSDGRSKDIIAEELQVVLDFKEQSGRFQSRDTGMDRSIIG